MEDAAAGEDWDAIRSYIRNVCVQDQARWEDSWKPAIASRGLVRPDVFVQTLEDNSVFFPRATARALVDRFRTPSGDVRVTRFLAWVALSRPTDHVDPERVVVARLPQPFRRVHKVLESDILDAAWDQITKQSARFRAEAAAALAATARATSGRSDCDDDEDARKRCCRRFERTELGDNTRVVAGAVQHDALPVLVVALEAASATVHEEAPAIVLHVVSTLTHESIATIALPLVDAACSRLRVSGLTPVRVCSSAALGGGGSVTLAVGVLLTESTTTPASDEQSESTTRVTTLVRIVHVVGVDTVALSRRQASGVATSLQFRITAAGTFEHLEWLELSPNGHHVALSIAPGRVSVFAIPESSAADASASVGSLDVAPAPFVDLNSAPALVTIDCGSALTTSASVRSSAHFVLPPTTHTRAAQLCPADAYALVVCVGTKVLKSILRPGSESDAAACASPVVSWSHLSAITSSALDATTQFLVVGLVDGALAVWDTLEETLRAYLPVSKSQMATAAVAGSDTRGVGSHRRDTSVDSVVMHRSDFVVAFSLAAQHVKFFDIRHHRNTLPMLRRVVVAPQSTGSQAGDSVVRMLSIVETTRVLDIPVAIVAYSNGTHVLYDMRSGAAIGSIRSPSPRPAAVLASPHGVVVAAAGAERPVLDFYDWRQLLLASFPSLERMLHAQDPRTAKRVFLSTDPALSVQLTPDRVPADAIEKLLRRTAGVASTAASKQRQSGKSGLELAASNSSAAVGSLTRLSTSDTDDVSGLPPLPDVALGPSTRSVRERFGEYARDLADASSKEKEGRMHRRRKELIKALTAGAW